MRVTEFSTYSGKLCR